MTGYQSKKNMAQDKLAHMTFEQRCRVSEQCLPEAPYREMLIALHDEMLAALTQPEQPDTDMAYTIALQRAIEWHCKSKVVPPDIAALCPHHAAKLNKALAQPEQEPVALLPKVDVCMRAEAHGIDPNTNGLYGFYVDCVSSSPPAQRKPLKDEGTVALIKQCRDAFSEELAAYDIDPPIYHVKQGYDNCVEWLAAHGIKKENT